MKPAYEALPSTTRSSFTVRKFEEKKFSAPYHFHPEYELTLITSGSGKRYVGSNMCSFDAGDLVLLGANLPHCWKTEVEKKRRKSGSVVIQFREEFLGNDFFSKPELGRIVQMLQRSKSGLQFGRNQIDVRRKIEAVFEEKNAFKNLLQLLEILHQLSKTRDFVLLDKQSLHADLSSAEQERISTANAYIIEHFQESVSLSNIAALANMTPHAFCRYFKKITRKTFLEAVTDYRIDFAVKQLINSNQSISQIGFDSGFGDVSNFHKTFKARMKVSPLQYRNTYLQQLES